jgi:hypothetical protein
MSEHMIWLFFLGLIALMVYKPRTGYFLVPLGLVILLVLSGDP